MTECEDAVKLPDYDARMAVADYWDGEVKKLLDETIEHWGFAKEANSDTTDGFRIVVGMAFCRAMAYERLRAKRQGENQGMDARQNSLPGEKDRKIIDLQTQLDCRIRDIRKLETTLAVSRVCEKEQADTLREIANMFNMKMFSGQTLLAKMKECFAEKEPQLLWVEHHDDYDNTWWEADSPFYCNGDPNDEESCRFRLEQRIRNNRIEWYDTSDEECSLGGEFWLTLEEAKAACEDARNRIISSMDI